MQVERRLFQCNLRGARESLSGGRVSNAWATCLAPWDNRGKLLLIPHKVYRRMSIYKKGYR
ncbi:hypothetical protein HMPREF9333_00870 [Johnsonella ignava ATCC 51276]|uniref:Uncharacterized protein n=1 Tax=Johnsonella ignava ATCC 51276 TaxID=679200 RepID=G5GH30_9FIRM|nr:hypothetical protein HMPREF9333_00870 [Johnsonella ignava ATCC 51276]